MKMQQRNINRLGLVFVAAIVTLYTFWGIIAAPATTLLNTSGDAAKNYFTYLYHATYDGGISFSGMNYPYGEHIIFTDAQPPVAWLASALYQLFYVQPLATLHILLAISFFFCIVYLYKLLKRFQLPYVWAICGAVLISAMSPQQYKLAQHFSLAYTCVLPMIFYYMVAWHQDKKLRYAVYLFISGVIFSLLHLYLALMICFWALLYSIFYFLTNKDTLRNKLKHVSIISIAGITPAVLVRILIFATDHITGRPSYPYGARWNRTFLHDIFTSATSPFSKILSESGITATLAGGGEGYTYTGIAVIIILAIAPVVYFFTRKQNERDNNTALGIWLAIAASMLIFATSVIFIRCFKCLDYASFIKQFRAVGRFAWVYYYIACVAAVILLYRWFKMIYVSRKLLAVLLVALTLTIWIAEAIPYTNMTRTRSLYGKAHYKQMFGIDKQQWTDFLKREGYAPSNFRALYALPYFHIGTEKLGLLAGSEDEVNVAFSTSLLLELPLMNVMLSRNSWEQAFGQIKTSGGPYTSKKVLRSRDYRPILIMCGTNYKPNPDEQYLIDNSRKIGSIGGNDMYALETATLLSKENNRKNELLIVYNKMSSTDTCITDSCGKWLVAHYDDSKSNNKLFSSGAQKAIDGITKIIFNDTITPLYDGEQYEFSAWMLVSDDDYKIGRFRIYLLDEHENIIGDIPVLTQEATDAHGLWLRASKYFPMPIATRRIKVEVVNIIYPAYLALDELMIRPANATIISKSENNKRVMMVNNHMISTD